MDQVAIEKPTLNEPTAGKLDNPMTGEPVASEPAAKKPTTFLSLARELRQKILFNTYNVESDSSARLGDLYDVFGRDEVLNPFAWKFSEHKNLIGAWTAVLREVDASIDFTQDLDYVKQKWLDELSAVRKRNEEFIEKTCPWHVSSKNRRVNADEAWMMNREGTAPWTRVHRRVTESETPKDRTLEQQTTAKEFSPVATLEDVVSRSGYFEWNRGPSGINWLLWGDLEEQPPSTWDFLNQAADEDIKSISKNEEDLKWLTKMLKS